MSDENIILRQIEQQNNLLKEKITRKQNMEQLNSRRFYHTSWGYIIIKYVHYLLIVLYYIIFGSLVFAFIMSTKWENSYWKVFWAVLMFIYPIVAGKILHYITVILYALFYYYVQGEIVSSSRAYSLTDAHLLRFR